MRSGLRAAVVVISIGFAAVPAAAAAAVGLPQIQRAAGFYRTGERALRAGNLHRAGASFQKALEILPNLAEAHLGLGHIAMAERRFEDALREYTLAKEHFSEIGEELFATKLLRYNDAQREIMDLRDDLAQLSRLPGLVTRAESLERAIDRLAKVEPPTPSERVGMTGTIDFHIGNALFRLGRLAEAVTSWSASVDRSPGLLPAYNNLAVGYWMLGRIDDARAVLARAAGRGLAVNPNLKADIEAGAARWGGRQG